MRIILITGILSTLIACSSGDFSGGARKGQSDDATTATKPVESTELEKSEKIIEKTDEPVKKDGPILADEAEEILSEDGELSEEDKKIVGCIEEWGQANISKDALRGYKKLTANNEGFSSSVLKDTKKTDEPRLVLVKAASTGFAGVRMELMNPNGWYCVDVKNVGFSASNLMLHCDSELAGYQTENKGFSNAQESRVGC